MGVMGDCTEEGTLEPSQSWKYMGRGPLRLQSECKAPRGKFDTFKGQRSHKSRGKSETKEVRTGEIPERGFYLNSKGKSWGL